MSMRIHEPRQYGSAAEVEARPVRPFRRHRTAAWILIQTLPAYDEPFTIPSIALGHRHYDTTQEKSIVAP